VHSRWLTVVVVTALVVGALALLPAATATTAASPLWVKMAKERLSNLDTRSASTMTGYSRARFGEAWFDVDLNGCSTRNDTLARDLREVEFKAGDHCFVTKGTLRDPYTNTTINFVQGPATSGKVQIDHVVALAAAWRTGAKPWTAGRRLFYANDDLVLLGSTGRRTMRRATKTLPRGCRRTPGSTAGTWLGRS
jgi:hypothetical protein